MRCDDMRYSLKAYQKGNGLFTVVNGYGDLVRAKCTEEEVRNLYRNGLYYALQTHYLHF